jgi:CHAT domain-containing protein
VFRKNKTNQIDMPRPEVLEALAILVERFLRCTSLSERYRMIIAHPDLLDKQSEKMMHFALHGVKEVPKKVGEQIWKEVSSMLTECRQYGAETILLKHHLRHAWQTGSESLRTTIKNATDPREPQNNVDSALPDEEAIRLWKALALHPDFVQFPEPRAYLLRQNAAANMTLFQATGDTTRGYRACESLAALGTNGTKEDAYQRCLYLSLVTTREHYDTATIEPLDLAIDECIKLLPDFDENAGEFVSLHETIGRLLVDRSRQSGLHSDLEAAVKHLLLSVEANTRLGKVGFDAVVALTSLGTAQVELFKRMQNVDVLEQGISNLRKAISIAAPGSVEMLEARSNLGLALKHKFQKTGLISSMKEALEHIEACADPNSFGFEVDGAVRLDNLGTALREYSESFYYRGQIQESLKPLNRSIDIHRQALKVLSEGNGPRGYQYGFLSNLGIALKNRAAIEPQESDLPEAIQCLERALQSLVPGAAFRCSLLNNLAMCQWSLYRDKDDSASLDSAIASMEQCVAAIIDGSSEQIEYLHRLASYKTSRYERTGQISDLKESVVTLERTVALAQETLDWAALEYKFGQQDQDVPINDLLVELRWMIGQRCPEERENSARRALELCESNKARVLSNMLNYQDLPAPDGVPTELLEKERSQLQRLSEFEREQLRSFGSTATTKPPSVNLAERRAIIDSLNTLWNEMKNLGQKAKEYAEARGAFGVSWEAMVSTANQLGNATALLSFFCSSRAIYVFVVKAGQAAPDMVRTPMMSADLQEFIKNFGTEIMNWHTHRTAGQLSTHRWQQLGHSLLVPVLPFLEGVEHIIASSHGQLHVLPLHALFVDDDQHCLIDSYSVSYTPSFGSLVNLSRKQQIRAANSLVLGYTPNITERDVFIGEAESVAKITNGKLAVNRAATIASVQQFGKEPLKVMHFSCHGAFNANSPLDSVILLADGELTVRAWLTFQLEAELVTLSACQVAQSAVLGGEEMVGFVQGILLSGGRAALLGSWNVNALVTKVIMERFYQNLFSQDAPRSKAEALRKAILELRNSSIPEELANAPIDLTDPYFWAAFCLHGGI